MSEPINIQTMKKSKQLRDLFKKRTINYLFLFLPFLFTSCSSGDSSNDIYFDASEVRNSELESVSEKFEDYRNKFVGKEVEVELWVISKNVTLNEEAILRGRLIVKDKDRTIISGSEGGKVEGFTGDNPIWFRIPLKDIQPEFQEQLKGEMSFIYNFLSNDGGSKSGVYDPEYCGDNVYYLTEQLGQTSTELSDEIRNGSFSLEEIIQKVFSNDSYYLGELQPTEQKYTIIKESFEREEAENGRKYVYNLSLEDRNKIKEINDKSKEKYFNLDWDLFSGLIIKVSGKIESVNLSDDTQNSKIFKDVMIRDSPYYFTLSSPVVKSVDWISPELSSIYEKSKTSKTDLYKLLDKYKDIKPQPVVTDTTIVQEELGD